jgi:xanthine dehydrogenase YagS FAD-binding subunit
MRPFEFVEPTTLAEVVRMLQTGAGQARLIAGGSDLLGEMKEDVVHYERLVSLAGLTELRAIHQDAAGLRLGACITLDELEHEPRLQGPYYILAEAARGVATPEIRRQGTLGGNLCQRPRCLYYRSALTPCLKKGGTDCPAVAGPYQDYLSIMGGPHCFSVHASDLAPPLIVLGGHVVLVGTTGERTLPLEQFFAGPERDVQCENVLAEDEVLSAVTLPPAVPHWRGTYLKARERTAGDFPLVSVALGYALVQGVIRHVRMALGGVAPVPWRSPQAEAVLEGQSPSPELATRAAQAALATVQPLRHNAFKVEIGRALIARAVLAVAALPRSEGSGS